MIRKHPAGRGDSIAACLLGVLLLFAPATRILGQEEVTLPLTAVDVSPPESPELAWAPFPARLNLDSMWVPYSGFSGGDRGSVSWYDVEMSLSSDFAAGDMLTLTPFVRYRYTDYEFSGRQTLLPGVRTPWRQVNDVQAGGLLRAGLAEKWALRAGASVGLAGEDGAVGGGQYGTTSMSVVWAPKSDLAISGGLGVRFGLEETEVFPVVGVDWQIDESWSLKTEGQGLRLGYQLTEAWSMGLFGRREDRRFRLDDKGAAGDGVAQVAGTPAGVDARYRVLKNLSVTWQLGVMLDSYIKVKDDDGRRINKVNLEDNLFVGLGLQMSF